MDALWITLIWWIYLFFSCTGEYIGGSVNVKVQIWTLILVIFTYHVVFTDEYMAWNLLKFLCSQVCNYNWGKKALLNGFLKYHGFIIWRMYWDVPISNYIWWMMECVCNQQIPLLSSMILVMWDLSWTSKAVNMSNPVRSVTGIYWEEEMVCCFVRHKFEFRNLLFWSSFCGDDK